jgi:hypothetical protein
MVKTMTYLPDIQVLRIGFPTHVSKGEITFSYLSNKRLNFTIPFKKISLFDFSTDKLEKGEWEIQVTWTDGIQEYYLEGKLVVL